LALVAKTAKDSRKPGYRWQTARLC